MITKGVFDPILDIVYQTMPRDNLLNSACLELFEFIKRENLKQLLIPLVEGYREKLLGINYVNTFGALVLKYEQIQSGFNPDETSFSTQGGETPNRSLVAGGQRWQGLKDADAEEEAYFNTYQRLLPQKLLKSVPRCGHWCLIQKMMMMTLWRCSQHHQGRLPKRKRPAPSRRRRIYWSHRRRSCQRNEDAKMTTKMTWGN
jgi:hypothetical protein